MNVFGNQLTVNDLIQDKAVENPNFVSITFEGEEFTRKWHVDIVNQTSNMTKELELEEGDIVAFLSHNSEDFIATSQLGVKIQPVQYSTVLKFRI